MAAEAGMDVQGDFAAFYDATWSRTVACAYAIAGELGAAEDIAQEAHTRAWPRWSRLSVYEEPAAWVRQVATRLAISRWRRVRVARAFLIRSRNPEPVPGPDTGAIALARALAQLPLSQRRAVVLHHLGDLPVREVAQLEGCPVGTIKARLSRGRSALAGLLGDATQDSRPARPRWRASMPELPGRQTDLDAAFAQLIGDVELRTSQPGAERAARTSRRRRTAVAGGLAALAILVASALGASFLVTGDRNAPVAAPVTSTSATQSAEPDPYPPAPLTVERLEEASRGWAQGWVEDVPQVRPDSDSCVTEKLNWAGVGDASNEILFRAGGRVEARLLRNRFTTSDEAGRWMSAVHEEVQKCGDSGDTGFHGYPSPNEVRSYEFGTGRDRSTAWFVLAGNRLSVFTVLGVPPPAFDEQRSAVADVLYQDLRAW